MIPFMIFLMATLTALILYRAFSAAGSSRQRAALSTAGVIVFSLILYTRLGTPTSPARETLGHEKAPAEAPLDDARSLGDAVRLLEDRLGDIGDNSEGLVLLGQGYMSLGRFTEAADAYARAHKIAPDDIGTLASLTEALIFAANGRINIRAYKHLAELRHRAPDHPVARFYGAMQFIQQTARPSDAGTVSPEAQKLCKLQGPAIRPPDAGTGSLWSQKLYKLPAPAIRQCLNINIGRYTGNESAGLEAMLALYRDENLPPQWRYRAGREAADILTGEGQPLLSHGLPDALSFPQFVSVDPAQAATLAQSLDLALSRRPNDVFALYHTARLAKEAGNTEKLEIYQRRLQRLLVPGSADARFVEKVLAPDR